MVGRAASRLARNSQMPIQLTIGALPAGPAVAAAVETALREDVPGLLGEMGYEPFGLPRLRVAIAAYLDRLGVPTDPDQVARHQWRPAGGPPRRLADRRPRQRGGPRESDLHRRDRRVPHDRQPADADAVDVEGPLVEVARLLAANAPIRLAYVVPTYHNPTGATMPEARRRDLASAAAEIGLLHRRGPHARHEPRARCPASDRRLRRCRPCDHPWLAEQDRRGGLRIGWIRAPAATSTAWSRARSSPTTRRA